MKVTRTVPQLASLVRRSVLYQQSRSFFGDGKGLDKEFVAKMQQKIDMSPEGIEKWLKRRKIKTNIESQRFVEQRHGILGPNLATAHFVCFRGGSVKFTENDEWYEKRDGLEKLPQKFDERYRLEAVDISDTELVAESLKNFINLDHLKYLRAQNCKLVNNTFVNELYTLRKSLQVLDLSACPLITEDGLATLHKLPHLRLLYLYNMSGIKYKQLLQVMLEEMLPQCVVEGLYEDPDVEQDSSSGKSVPDVNVGLMSERLDLLVYDKVIQLDMQSEKHKLLNKTTVS